MEFRFPRSAIDLEASVMTMRGPFNVRVVNLSRSGCAIVGLPPMPAGTRLMIELGFMRVSAQIVWQRLGRSGVRLSRILSTQDMARLRLTAARISRQHARPGETRALPLSLPMGRF